jgi:hypothetical protein
VAKLQVSIAEKLAEAISTMMIDTAQVMIGFIRISRRKVAAISIVIE